MERSKIAQTATETRTFQLLFKETVRQLTNIYHATSFVTSATARLLASATVCCLCALCRCRSSTFDATHAVLSRALTGCPYGLICVGYYAYLQTGRTARFCMLGFTAQHARSESLRIVGRPFVERIRVSSLPCRQALPTALRSVRALMLRQLAALCRPLALQHSLPFPPQSALAVQSRHSFYSTPGAHGLEEFFEAPLSEAEKPRVGDPAYHIHHTSPVSCLALPDNCCCKCRQRMEGS